MVRTTPKGERKMISQHAIVQSDQIGERVKIDEFAIVRKGAVIGNDVVIHPNVFIGAGVVLEDGVEVFHGAVLGKEPKGAGALARQPVFERRIRVGANTSIGPHVVLFYDVEIGQSTLIGDGASIREQCRIGSKCIISRYVTINYNTTIGDRTKIMDLTHITGNCRIGNDVFISVSVASVNDNAIGHLGYDEARVQGPILEDGVAVGTGAILLPEVLIGFGSIVGAGAVVTKNVDPKTLVMGMPARLVRRLEAKDEP
jgi:acetyltransferase-like isoleucine patch superfamily enzyme